MKMVKIDERWTLWERNVVDEFKNIPTEEIKKILGERALPAAVLMSQLESDFNFSNVIRTSNFFNLKTIFYYGIKNFDRRGSVGTHLYSDVKYLPSFDEIKKLKEQYVFVGLENNIEKNTTDIFNFKWPSNSLIIIGEENKGLSNDIIDLCDFLVEIPNYGSVRSLNAATAAAIAIGLLSSQFRK